MHQFSSNQRAFVLVSVLLTSAFLYSLSYCISNQNWNSIIFWAVVFGVAMFGNGFWFGYKDNQSQTRVDLSFRYHLLTYFSVNGVFILSFIIPGFMQFFTLEGLAGQFLAWGFGLLLHFYLSKRTIKGYDPEEIF